VKITAFRDPQAQLPVSNTLSAVFWPVTVSSVFWPVTVSSVFWPVTWVRVPQERVASSFQGPPVVRAASLALRKGSRCILPFAG